MNFQNFQVRTIPQIPEWLAELRVPGAAVALVENGRPGQAYAFGTANSESGEEVRVDTIFEAASLSKPVAAYAALQLVDRGLLDLDRPLVDYMADGRIAVVLEGRGPDKHFLDLPMMELVTSRQVLIHTSGLPNSVPEEGDLRIHFPPGGRYSYSSVAYGLLQTIIEVLSGQDCPAYVEDNIFEPLKMGRSTFVWNGGKDWPLAVGHEDDGKQAAKELWLEMRAGGGLHCSATDYARFLAHVLQPNGDSSFHLSADLWAEMIRPQIQVNDSAPWQNDWPRATFVLNDKVGWGLGWGTQETREGAAIWQWGDNGVYKNFVLGFPDQGLGLVIMTNSRNGFQLNKRILVALMGSQLPAVEWLESLKQKG